MALTDEGYVPEDAETLFEEGEDIHLTLDPTANTGPGTARRATIQTMARLLAQNQEQELRRVYDAGFVATASGRDLERRCNDFGISRKPAQPATGVVEFYRDSEPNASYVIPSGTLVETADEDPVTFATQDQQRLGLIDGFEDGSLDADWNGDGTVVDGSASGDPDPDDGRYELRFSASSSNRLVYEGTTLAEGDTIRCSVYAESGTILGINYFEDTGGGADPDRYEYVINTSNDSLTLNVVDGGTTTELDSTAVSVPTGEWLTVDVDTSVNDVAQITLTDAADDVVAVLDDSDGSGDGDDAHREGYLSFDKQDSSDQTYVDAVSRMATAATIEATAGGQVTNVGPRAITAIPNKPAGVGGVVNHVPTGDTEYDDATHTTLVPGQDRESDEDLRQRVFDASAIGGAATVGAVAQALYSVDDVVSVKIVENDTLTDNTGSGGLPPISIEPIVFGGSDEAIAEALFDAIAATERLYSGANGTSVTYTVTDDVLTSDETVEWSEPPKVDVDITLDLVVDDTYVGDDAIRDTIVDYVGGTSTDGSTTVGTGIGENVRIDAIRDRVVGPDTGVRGISSVSTTPSTSTDSNGLSVVSIASEEVARVDATDGSLTITTTEL